MYSFTSHWSIAAAKPQVMQALLESDHWQSWWPGLEQVNIINQTEAVGSRYRCVWRSQAGYSLTTVITVTDLSHEKRIAFDSTGDLIGAGRFELSHGKNDTTNVTIYWNVTPSKPWMQRLSFLLRPFFVYNHHKIMDDGEAGLIKYLNK